MKKRTNQIMLLPLLAILNACGIIQADWYDTIILSNDINDTIKIISYHAAYYNEEGELYRQTDTILAPGANYLITQHNGEGGSFEDPAKIFHSDSMCFVFADTCFADYWSCLTGTPDCMDTKNPYKPMDYYDEDCTRNGGCDYVYRIVEEDFECSQAPE